jgi:hypothetical protein
MLPEYKGLLHDQVMWFLSVLVVILIKLIVARGVEKFTSYGETLLITSSLVSFFWAKVCCPLINFTDLLNALRKKREHKEIFNIYAVA